MNTLIVGFVGASHLAYVSAVAAAEKCQGNWKVLSFAPQHSIEMIEEPNLDHFLQKNKNNIEFTTRLEDLRGCDLVYFSIDVPTDSQGHSDLNFIQENINLIIPYINKNAILVILSQVNPGFTRNIDFPKNRLFYQVETLIFGNAMERALYPERFIIGSVDKAISLPNSFKNYLDNFQCPQFLMTYESAELAKISINLYLISSITTTNMLVDIAQKIGAEWEDISQTLKLDKRIGPYAYLKPGLGLAGGNLERDIATLKEIAISQGAFVKTLDAQVADSRYRANWVLRIFKKLNLPSQDIKLGILGLSYKENTHSLKNSPSINFLKSLDKKLQVHVFDPRVKNVSDLDNLLYESCVPDVLHKTNVLAVLTPWPLFYDIDYADFEGYIIDPYKVVKNAPKAKFIYQLG